MRSLYVVVVDDEEQVCRLAARMLADVGCRVTEAHSGAEALSLLAGSVPFGLVVSDIAMPGMTGEELAAHIGERWPAIPVLLISGQGGPHPGFSGVFLPKPFTREALLEAVTQVLSHARAD
jgi:CheY-like chemotaxis protein